MFKSNLRTALLGSGAAVAMMAVAVPASADEMSELKAQIDALQGKLATLEARQTATESSKVAPAAAIEAGDKPKSLKWAGTNTSVSFSGYAKVDMIYDIGQTLGDSAFVAGATAVGAARNIQNNFRAHARQSRLRFQSWTPTDWGELATHIEGDFEATPTNFNQRAANGTSLRLRHAFGRLGPVLGGQTWSTFMDISSWPETVDFHGPSGGLFVRQAQVRYTHSFGNGFRLQAAVENAEGSGISTGGAAFSNGNLDPIPDFAGNLRYSFDSGYLMGKAVVGLNRIDNGAGASDTEFGWGLSGSGVINLGPNDSIGFEVSWLEGMNRYMLAGLGIRNVTCSGTCATGLDSISNNSTIGGFVWYRHRWTDTMRSTVSYSGAVNHSTPGPAATPLQNLHQIHANLVWSPVSAVNIGFEVQYWTIEQDTGGSGVPGNSNADGVRLQLGMQYNF